MDLRMLLQVCHDLLGLDEEVGQPLELVIDHGQVLTLVLQQAGQQAGQNGCGW